MITQIGITAGEIWMRLEKFPNISFVELLESLEKPDRPKDLLLMSLGWLIRGGYVRWIPGDYGGRLLLVQPTERRFQDEKQYKDSSALNCA